MRGSYVVASLLTFFALQHAQGTRLQAEQSTFSIGSEGPVVRHTVSLTPAELTALAKDELMRDEMEQQPPVQALTGQGLEAAEIHLFNAKERDLIIIGSGSPFLGANVCPFWIIRELPDGPRVVLHVITLSVEIGTTRTRSLRNISAISATAATNTVMEFDFNGKEYVAVHSKTRPNAK